MAKLTVEEIKDLIEAFSLGDYQAIQKMNKYSQEKDFLVLINMVFDSYQQDLETDANNPKSYVGLGFLYAGNFAGIPYNEQLAKQNFEKAASLDHIGGKFLLGDWYDRNEEGNEEDSEKGIEYYAQAAESGHPQAQVELGKYYQDKALQKELPLVNAGFAFQFYQMASNQDHAEGIHKSALCYLNGFGVEQNTVKAKELFNLAADQGYQYTISKKDISVYKDNFNSYINDLEKIKQTFIDKNDPNYQKVIDAASKLITTLKEESDKFFNVASFFTKESCDVFVSKCTQAMNKAMDEFKVHRGAWQNFHPAAKAILGFLAIITILPAIIVQAVTKCGIKGTFFKKPNTNSAMSLKEVQTKLNETNEKMKDTTPEQEKEFPPNPTPH